MDETLKCYNKRLALGDFSKYLRGQGIDIGCGNDCLRVLDGNVRPWDLQDGDAQLLATIEPQQFDFVYSSHCLEHMRSVEEALTHWVRVLKPGGFLYVVVPDFVLYEKMLWPSRFNGDHKQSFSIVIDRARARRENHFHIEQDLTPLLERLGVDVLEVRLEDDHFDYNAGPVDQTIGRALAQICIIGCKRDKGISAEPAKKSSLILPAQTFVPPTVDEQFEFAYRLHQSGDLSAAERGYVQVLAQQSEHAMALHYYGVLLLQHGRPDAALPLLDRAVAAAPNAADFHANRGPALRMLGRIDEAIAAYEQALQINPQHAKSLANLGKLLQVTGRHQNAIPVLQRAVTYFPDNAELHYVLAASSLQVGSIIDAVEHAHHAVQLRQDFAQAYELLGEAMRLLNQWDASVAAFTQAIQIAPNGPSAYEGLAVTLDACGRADDATALRQRASTLRAAA